MRGWLLAELRASGVRAEEHAFEAAPRRQRRGRRARGDSVVAAVRARRGDGKEALVLVTPLGGNGTLALGVGVALLRHLADAPWLSRDLLLLAADDGAASGAHAAAEAWLAEYQEAYGPAWHGVAPPPPPPAAAARFLRAGVLSAALVLEAPAASFDALQLRVQGVQGALPNLDVVALLRALAPAPLRLPGEPWAGTAEAGHAATWAQYVASVRAAARFLGRQAHGAPDGCACSFVRSPQHLQR